MSTPPTRTGRCCPSSERRWRHFPPTVAGRSASCSTVRAATASSRSTTWADSSPVQPPSTRSSSASRRARPSRWIHSSGWRCAWRGALWKNSGINPDDMAGHDVGCYVGASATGVRTRAGRILRTTVGICITGTSLGVISGRIAYTLGSGGTGDDHRHLVLVGAGGVSPRRTGGPERRLRPRVGRRRVRDGLPWLLRRVLQAARAVRRRPLPSLQRARQRHGLGGGRGDVPAATKVCAHCPTGARSSPRFAPAAVNHDGRTVGLTAPSGDRAGPTVPPAIGEAGVRPERRRDGRGARHRHPAR